MTAAADARTGAHGRPRGRPSFLRGYFWLLAFLLYLPLVILFVFSVNANTSLTFPLKGFTLGWYEKLFASENLLHAVGNSMVVAVASSAVATVIGTMLALLLSRFEFRGKGLLTGLAILPLIVPYVVLAVALL